jgi:homoserine kinase
VSAISCPWPDAWSFLVLTPELGLATSKARQALPANIALRDAVANIQRVASLIAAVHKQDRSALTEVFDDRLHQPFRQSLVPGLKELLAVCHPQILGVFLSGAGPSIAAVIHGDGSGAEKALAEAYSPLGIPFEIRHLRVHKAGETTRGHSSAGG